MATPVIIQILNEVGARLTNLTIANGYSIDLRKITRDKGTPWENGDLPELDYWVESLETTTSSYAGSQWTTVLNLICITNKTDKKNHFDISATLEADIITVLNRNTSAPSLSDNNDKNLGGLVNKITGYTSQYATLDIQDNWAVVQLSITLEYQTKLNDLFTLANI